ncbi:MAG: hypothetical protein U0935_16765 [Pirellulales bacterium]
MDVLWSGRRWLCGGVLLCCLGCAGRGAGLARWPFVPASPLAAAARQPTLPVTATREAVAERDRDAASLANRGAASPHHSGPASAIPPGDGGAWQVAPRWEEPYRPLPSVEATEEVTGGRQPGSG